MSRGPRAAPEGRPKHATGRAEQTAGVYVNISCAGPRSNTVSLAVRSVSAEQQSRETGVDKGREGGRHLPSCLMQDGDAQKGQKRQQVGPAPTCTTGHWQQWVLAQSCPRPASTPPDFSTQTPFAWAPVAKSTQPRPSTDTRHRHRHSAPKLSLRHHAPSRRLRPLAPRALSSTPPPIAPGPLCAVCARNALMHPTDDQPSPPDPAERAHCCEH